MKRLTGLVVLGVALFPAIAFGEVSVTVLGLRSATADEQIASQMTEALREAASEARSSGITHTGRENQLSQLLVVFDCEDTTPRCMREIGRSLDSQRLIYGLIEPESGRSDADYAVTLRYFNVETGEVERDLRERIPRGVTPQNLAERASRFFMALTGTVMPGQLAITCNVEGAEVLIGDREVGTTSDEPLMIEDLEPGDISVAVHHEGYASFRRTVTIEPGETLALDVELGTTDGGTSGEVGSVGGGGEEGGGETGWTEPEPTGRRSLAWLGWTSLGLSAVFGGLGLWTSLHVNNVRNDTTLQWNYPDTGDICETDALATAQGYSPDQAEDKCRTAETLELLQAVFYPLAAVTFGIGLWLVIREMRGDDQEARRLEVIPVAFNDGGAVAATLSF